MTAPTLGGDPGHEGAATLLAGDGRHVLGWWLWRPHVAREDGQGTYGLWDWQASEWTELPSLHAVASVIAMDAEDLGGHGIVVAMEGLFVPPYRPPAGVLSLAEATGELLGPLRGLGEGTPLRPLASTWRPSVLGLPRNAASEVAERAAVVYAQRVLVGLEEAVNPHLAESACIARWGWVQGQQASQLELAGGRRG